MPHNSLGLAGAAKHQPEQIRSPRTKKRALLVSLVLLTFSVAGAADIPSGLTGLWLFSSDAHKLKAAIGYDLVNSTPANAGWLPGAWTKIGVGWHAELYSDGGTVMDRSWDYLTVNPVSLPMAAAAM